MRVLFISHYTALYGANKSLLGLLDGLGDSIQPMVLLPEEGPLSEALEKRKIPVHITDFYCWFYRNWRSQIRIPLRMLKNLQAAKALAPIINNFKPDLIYANSSVIALGYLLSKRYRIPHIIHVREFIKQHYYVQYDLGTTGMNYVYNNTDAVIAVSTAIATGLLSAVDAKRKHVIYNGIIEDNNFTSKARELKPGSITFGIIGLLSEGKKFEEMIAAFKIYHHKHPESRLLVVGDSELEYYKAALRQQAGSLVKTGTIQFTGYVHDMQTIYEQLDVHVICSAAEALGRVTIEAMKYGVPSIGYRGGGTPEIIEDYQNGLLYDGGPEELAVKMEEITTAAYYQQFSRNGLTTATTKFTRESYCRKVFAVMQDITKRS